MKIECEEDVNWVVLHLKQRLIGHYGLITESLFLRTLCLAELHSVEARQDPV